MMNYQLFLISRENTSCQLYLSEEVYKTLKELVEPFFIMKKISNPNKGIWTIFEDINTQKINEGFFQSIEQNGNEPAANLYFNYSTKEILLNETPLNWRPMFILRLVRNILRWEMYKQGATFLHGGLVEYKNNGIAIVGPKKAGKTSTILSLLAKEKVNFSTNDDVVVKSEEGSLKAYGWPRSIGVRKDTLLSLKNNAPKYLDSILRLKHPGMGTYGFEKHLNNLPNIVDFLPMELASCYQKRTISCIDLNFIVFPRYCSSLNPSIELLDSKQANDYLIECLEELPSSYSVFLNNYYGARDKDHVLLAKDIIEKTVCIKLNQSMENLEHASNMLILALEKLILERKLGTYE